MPISLKGGPLDGTISRAPSHLPLYMVATNLDDRPIYKRTSCSTCACKKDSVSYIFVGYEKQADTERVRGH
jgi:hypothetical protein